MEQMQATTSKPQIIIGKTDHTRLSGLAEGALERIPEVADGLLVELERAKVVADDQIAPDVIKMGSSATYEVETGEKRNITLVYPGEADIAASKVSILTPIGVALIGLAPGQSMTWQSRDGEEHKLSVIRVETTAPAAG